MTGYGDLPPEIVLGATRLREQWRESLEHVGTYAGDHAEQLAYDSLIEFVEANGLNYSAYDPRHETPETPTERFPEYGYSGDPLGAFTVPTGNVTPETPETPCPDCGISLHRTSPVSDCHYLHAHKTPEVSR